MNPQPQSRAKRSIRGKTTLSIAGKAAVSVAAGNVAWLNGEIGSAIPMHAQIEVAAYYRAQKRGFEPGHELEDWLAAESQVLATLVPAPPDTAHAE